MKNITIKLMVSTMFVVSALTIPSMAADDAERLGEVAAHPAVAQYEVLPGKKPDDVKLKKIDTDEVYGRAGTVVYVVNGAGQKSVLLGQTVESVNPIDPAGNKIDKPLEYSFFSGKITRRDLSGTIKETLANTRTRELGEEVGLVAAKLITTRGVFNKTMIVAGDSVKRGGAEDRTTLVELQNVILYAEYEEIEGVFNDSIRGTKEFTGVKLFDISTLNLAAELEDWDRFPLIREGVEKEQWNNFAKHYHPAFFDSLKAFQAGNALNAEEAS